MTQKYDDDARAFEEYRRRVIMNDITGRTQSESREKMSGKDLDELRAHEAYEDKQFFDRIRESRPSNGYDYY